MFKRLALCTFAALTISGCQSLSPKVDGISEEQERALQGGRIEAAYTRIHEVCPLTDSDKDNIQYRISAVQGVYSSDNPFYEYYSHGKKSVLAETREQLKQRVMSAASSGDLLDGCDAALAETATFAQRARQYERAMFGGAEQREAVSMGKYVQALQIAETACKASDYYVTHIQNVIYNLHRQYHAGSKYYRDFAQGRLRDGSSTPNDSPQALRRELISYAKAKDIEEACGSILSEAVAKSQAYGQ